MIRVGVVGYGFSGRSFHSYLIGRVPDLRLAAVVTRSPERRAQVARERGVPIYSSLGEMLRSEDLDLVVVATPHDTHAPLAIEAMDAGKHVVVDKVMCLNGEEADEMLAASRRNGVLLSVFQNRRWDWDYLTVRKVLDEGLLGAPYLFEVAIMRYRQTLGWRAEVGAGGGLLYDWGPHLLDQALQLVPGETISVSCDIQYRGWGAEIGSYCRLLLRFASGVLFGVEIGCLARVDKPRWLVLGELGSLVKYGAEPQLPALVGGNIEAAAESPSDRARVRTELGGLPTEMVVESVRGDWTSYYRNVADALAGRAELIVRPEEVRRSIAVLDAAMRSAASGETVRVRV